MLCSANRQDNACAFTWRANRCFYSAGRLGPRMRCIALFGTANQSAG